MYYHKARPPGYNALILLLGSHHKVYPRTRHTHAVSIGICGT